MDFFKKLFNKKNKPKKIEKKIDESVSKKNKNICFYCNEDILISDKVAKKAGKLFHRKCWKKIKKSIPI